MQESAFQQPLDAVRTRVRAIEEAGRRGAADSLPFGIEAIDGRLSSGGLAGAALHELTGASPSLNDDAAATLFAAGIAARLSVATRTVLWALARRDLFAPALAQAGLIPDRLICAECGRDEEVLAVVEEALRDGGLAAVVGEVGRVSMTATRRLQLAAEEGQTLALMLKRWRGRGQDPLAVPSTAMTRWRIGCVPSTPVFGSVARPRWKIELVRQRGGGPHHWIVEGSDAQGRLALAAEPANRPAAPDRGEGRQIAAA